MEQNLIGILAIYIKNLLIQINSCTKKVLK